MFVWDGQCYGIGVEDGERWHPDLWLGIRNPLEPEYSEVREEKTDRENAARPDVSAEPVPYLLFPLLFEASAKADATVATALRPIRTAGHDHFGRWVFLVVCGSNEAAQLFCDIGNDLTMLATTYWKFVSCEIALGDVTWTFRTKNGTGQASLARVVANLPASLLNWSL